MALSNEEKMRVMHHLGYPLISVMSLMGLGVPTAGQPQFILQKQMDNIIPEGEQSVREALCECEAIEKQLKEVRQRLSVSSTGGVRFRTRDEIDDLEDLYERWTDVLADMLYATKNPVSRHSKTGAYFES